jgi:PAS domain S-box-containing protein
VSPFSTTRLVGSTTISPALRASVKPIATYLGESAGAWACYLALVDRAGQTPRLLATSKHADDIPAWRAIEGAALVRRALSKHEMQMVQAGAWPALALPLVRDNRPIGAALLLYTTEMEIDTQRAVAAAGLAACALDSVRQVAALHFQAEEIEERTRLREIQVSRNLIRGIIDSIPMELALLDVEGTVLAANRTLSGRFGLEPAVLVGMSYDAVLGPWQESPAAQTFASGMARRVRRTLQRPDGQVLLEISSIPLLDHEGQPHQVVEIWEDITERVALQTQLVRVEKLAAIGQLAASIAHEVGNPLQAIQGFLALFLEQCPPETPNQRFLELAEEEIDRIVQVLARLRDLYRPRADVVAWVDVNTLIGGVLLLTGKQLERRRIRVLRELDLTLPKIQGVADQLKQVLLNLVLNAAEAMAEGGLLHIQTFMGGEHPGGRAVLMTITDTGAGIPPDQLSYIFDGLHTTKERGMGLGLYTSKAIVERHMGRISAQSTPGEGTTFTITLPIDEEENAV